MDTKKKKITNRPSEYNIKDFHKVNLSKLYSELIKKDKDDTSNK